LGAINKNNKSFYVLIYISRIKAMENQNVTAAEEFNITPIAVKEFALNSAKMDVILQLQVEILAHLRNGDKTEVFARVNQNIKELTLEWYIQNSIKK
jgi:hypothetical protein